jgi:dihydrofolate synthase/folylpolyglutamate synthase
MNLKGRFQFNNAAIAVALLLLWLERTETRAARDKIEAAVRSGLREVHWPGRLEAIRQDPLMVVDVGHTPDGIRQSLASLKAIYGAEGWILVVGVSFDKKADEIVGALAPSFDTIIATTAHHKGAEARDIATAVRKANPQATVHVATTVADAVAIGHGLAVSQDRKIYVAGGLFLAAEYAVVVGGGRAQDLKFF